jgi:hypothetical protein
MGLAEQTISRRVFITPNTITPSRFRGWEFVFNRIVPGGDKDFRNQLV